MEERIRRLEQRVAALEREVDALKSMAGVASGLAGARREGDAGRLEDAYRQLAKKGRWVWIHELRASLGWEPERFDRVLDSLWSGGEAELRETDQSLSIRQMGDSYALDDGRMFTQVALLG
ncbi:MAG: hypothetical protein KKA60_06260 [Proteobacteria bacterium]|nr:hypothetical protein [Pseudomonadota bacterium]